MYRNGYGPILTWADLVIGRNDPESFNVCYLPLTQTMGIVVQFNKFHSILFLTVVRKVSGRTLRRTEIDPVEMYDSQTSAEVNSHRHV